MATMIVVGGARVIARLESIRRAYPGTIERALQKGGHAIEREAKRYCPVDTNRLRASIHAEPVIDFEVHVGTDVEYAPHVEYGTHKLSAQPYLRPGMNSAKPAIAEAFIMEIKKTHAIFSLFGGVV